ncbi:hypothetical protein IE81DRAFT_162389 [Ceraceosorus guamensis]|uniref:Uncharacterized protein n=1 Tax=Ceraceosorus guamensis TaxID=1522189 RepID=A0A316WCI9_9BASI|nr:hypothetical protein IE81DRAFT_162389 [Ceraceosorus guamensis]PWN45583.1 hypothetical protein IE81DRAFT_162389 [Ceraceosorus guamensis]
MDLVSRGHPSGGRVDGECAGRTSGQSNGITASGVCSLRRRQDCSAQAGRHEYRVASFRVPCWSWSAYTLWGPCTESCEWEVDRLHPSILLPLLLSRHRSWSEKGKLRPSLVGCASTPTSTLRSSNLYVDLMAVLRPVQDGHQAPLPFSLAPHK